MSRRWWTGGEVGAGRGRFRWTGWCVGLLFAWLAASALWAKAPPTQESGLVGRNSAVISQTATNRPVLGQRAVAPVGMVQQGADQISGTLSATARSDTAGSETARADAVQPDAAPVVAPSPVARQGGTESPARAQPVTAEPAQQRADGAGESSAGLPDEATLKLRFERDVQPLLKKYCVRCHNVDDRQSGVRVDHIDGSADEQQIALFQGIRRQVDEENMPPEEEPQPSAAERSVLTEWLSQGVRVSESRKRPRLGSVRRLTVAQYRNTLRDLLGLREDLTDTLPPDGVSKDGFVNNAQLLGLTPLQVESYFEIAERALDAVLVDETQPPTIQHFKMELGRGINASPCPEALILGANSELLGNADFVVTEPELPKPFPFRPFRMQTQFDFIEGYAGNDTVRGWRHYDSIYHAVFACVRGTPGYPQGLAYQVVPAGLLLRPAIPSPEIFGQSNTYGPMANFKISLRQLPDRGNFRVRVQAARYEDGWLLPAGTPQAPATPEDRTLGEFPVGSLAVATAGVYQVEVTSAGPAAAGPFSLQVGERQFHGTLHERPPAEGGDNLVRTSWLVLRLPAGPVELRAQLGDNSRLRGIRLARLDVDSEVARRFAVFERRTPWLGVHVGLRRDCGSTLARVGDPVAVRDGGLHDYVFEGAIADFPAPEVEENNVNYLAGVREIGVRSEFTDGREMPRLLIRAIEFEGPFYESWPPANHRQLLPERDPGQTDAEYARKVIAGFATRAWRRPATDAEVDSLLQVWQTTQASTGELRRALRDAFLVVLTSPQFLFLVERSESPDDEELEPHELASKLSYFLWNSPPDERLLELASTGRLATELDGELDRMVADPRFERFVEEFASQWLGLEKFDVLSVDQQKFPGLTRDVRTELRREPVAWVLHLLRQNRPVRELVQSETVLVNEVMAAYYGLGSQVESGFGLTAVAANQPGLGGVLGQAALMAGLSDGREANPVKRGAWLARRIVAEPPEDPPPNVPQLPQEGPAAKTLRERLEQHRSQRGCAKCHSGIDPWGVPLLGYDAGGRFTALPAEVTRSTLPDGTEVAGAGELRDHLAQARSGQLAFSVLKHLSTYAVGRSLRYNELTELHRQAARQAERGYPLRDLLRSVVLSDLFRKK